MNIQEDVESKLCLGDELECAAVQEPIEVEAKEPIQFHVKEAIEVNFGDVLLEEQEEILILGEDLAPEIDEPMPQVLP